ncbi:MAG: hypothetical protein QXF82_01810 [Nitrososphaeria archaeon]
MAKPKEGCAGISRVFARSAADGAYDSKANFEFPAKKGIKPIIRVRGNSVPED